MPKKKPQEEEPELEELFLEDADVETNLDPHLQQYVIKSETEFHVMELTGPDEAAIARIDEAEQALLVDVIAKLHDPEVAVEGLQVTSVIGDIVTGVVDSRNIEAVRRHPNVRSLKGATRLHADLRFSVPEIEAAPDQLRANLAAGDLDGRGVIVGVVDFGCDFVHRNFRHTDGSTRLLFLWDQGGGPTSASPAGYGYGREFDAAAINAALQATGQPENTERAYTALVYRPPARAHGTHVMDIAAGNGQATGMPGVAPAADLIFVQMATDESAISGEESLGNSRNLLEAVDYIFKKAEALGRPAVVNVSLGTHGGPHDGSTLVEQGLDALLGKPGRAIVISAGNSRQRHSHASGQVSAAQPRTLRWEISPGDATDNEMEIWYDGGHELAVTVVTPGGLRLGPVPSDTTKKITSSAGERGRIIHRRHDPNNGDNQVDILLSRMLPAGTWLVELTTTEAEPIGFHAWIERDQKGQSRFAPEDDDPTHTIGSISCGALTIAVGAYNGTVPERDPAPFSSEGPTRDGKRKPEVSAPGQGIRAAQSLSQGFRIDSGTSMAAPHVTGAVALLMQVMGTAFTVAEARRLLAEHVRRNAAGVWDARYGEGRINALAVLRTLVQPAGPEAAGELEGAPVFAQPEAAVATSASPDGLGLAQLVETLSRAAATTGSRVRIEIEVEPVRA
jgi:subtilisin family serine protease